MEGKDKNQNVIRVNPGTFVGSQYAQIVGVIVTENDITLEFVYQDPRNIGDAQVVSRVTMPQQAALGLAETIFKVKQTHEAKKRGK